MRPFPPQKTTLALSLLLVFALAAVAFAVDDTQPSKRMKQGSEYYQGHHGFHGKGQIRNCLKNISKEEAEKLKAECQKFHESTRDLRMEIKSKRLAVKSELAKPSPDRQTAVKLQKELSGLQAKLAEQRVLHLITMKEISPRAEMWCKCTGNQPGCFGMGGKAGKGRAVSTMEKK